MSQFGNSAWSWAFVSTRSGRWTAMGPTAAKFTGPDSFEKVIRRQSRFRRDRVALAGRRLSGKSQPTGLAEGGQLGKERVGLPIVMDKSTDIRITDIRTETERIGYRSPIKFGGRVGTDGVL